MSAAHRAENILIIGGGDGLAAREVYKFASVKSVTIVDIDPAITNFAKDNQLMRELNKESMRDPRTRIINADAWKHLESDENFYDVIIIDLPDPDNLTLSRLYSRTFYRLISRKLSRGGTIVTQSTSPLYSHKAFWCIYNTFLATENPLYANDTASSTQTLDAKAYHTYVPSFGEWGFVMASNAPIDWEKIEIKVPARFVSNEYLLSMGTFPEDMDQVETEINSIDTHIIKNYYEEGWDKWAL
jgi:spermidine synthase